MDGENHGNPYEQMDDLGGNTPILGKHPYFARQNPPESHINTEAHHHHIEAAQQWWR